MRFSAFFACSLAIVSGVSSAALPSEVSTSITSPPQPPGAKIVAAINRIRQAVNNLDIASQQVTGPNATQLLAVQTAGIALGQTAVNETKAVQAAPKLDNDGVFNVQIAISLLIDADRKLAKDTEKIRPVVEQAGLKQAVLASLKAQREAAAAFNAAFISKFPSLFKPLAQYDAKQITSLLDEAIKAYSS